MNYKKRLRDLESLVVDLCAKNNQLEKLLQKKDLGNVIFTDFLSDWFETHRLKIRRVTASSYHLHLSKHIIPYFKQYDLKLCDITSTHINQYCLYKYNEELSPQTIKHHYSTLRCALNFALRNDLIIKNPCLNVELPKIYKYKPSLLSFTEILNFAFSINNNPLYIPTLLSGLLGLRRSEVVGLTWECVDFKKHCINIRNTYIEGYDNTVNAMFFEFSEQTKNEASTRTLALPAFLESELIKEKNRQLTYAKHNTKYNKNYLSFVCVNNKGNIISPNYISRNFGKKIKVFFQSDYKHIRYHDLRHSCATYLHEEMGFDIKDIQIYLGHSDISTTGNIYTHINKPKMNRISKVINNNICSVTNCHEVI